MVGSCCSLLEVAPRGESRARGQIRKQRAPVRSPPLTSYLTLDQPQQRRQSFTLSSWQLLDSCTAPATPTLPLGFPGNSPPPPQLAPP